MEDKIECPNPDSELDTCPSGSAMNLRFKKCSFENHAIRFECLGHWTDQNNKKYLALMNTRAQDKLGPHYRCAVSFFFFFAYCFKIKFVSISNRFTMKMQRVEL